MKTYIKRIVMGILGSFLAACMLPVSAAGQNHPRILRLEMDEQTDIALYFVAELEDALFGRVTISREPTAQELERILCPENLAAERKTDRQGNAEINFSEMGLKDGVYLVADGKCQPFYVCVPAPDGDRWRYTVEAAPGYRIGGEAEPMPEQRQTVELSVESTDASGELSGIFLVMAGGWAFLRSVLRPESG